jgi:glucose 1-dehydrogenase
MERLRGKRAIVTGAGSGIGRAIAIRLSEEGARVALADLDTDAAEGVASDIGEAGGETLVVKTDVTRAADVEALVGEVVRGWDGLDVMVNNAGVEHKMPFLETPLETWETVIAVNLTGPWLGCQMAARQMVSQGGPGRIINVSSVHEDLAMSTNAPYCAAKGGLRMLTRTIALELAPHAITVNNVAPGAIATPMDAKLEQDPAQMEMLLAEIPLGRMGKPEEVASLVLYLASDAAAYATGSTYFMDGGMIRHSGSL